MNRLKTFFLHSLHKPSVNWLKSINPGSAGDDTTKETTK
jgi:hypothetical protein